MQHGGKQLTLHKCQMLISIWFVRDTVPSLCSQGEAVGLTIAPLLTMGGLIKREDVMARPSERLGRAGREPGLGRYGILCLLTGLI